MTTPRVRRPPNRRHSHQYLLNCEIEQRRAWHTAADAAGLSLAQWIRKTLDEQATATISYAPLVHISTNT